MPRRCPYGDGEFDDRFRHCPKCGAPLTDQPVSHDDSPAQLAIAPNEAIAGMWVSALEGDGIMAFSRPLGPGFGAWASVATFEHEILVRKSDLARARESLAAFTDDGEAPDH